MSLETLVSTLQLGLVYSVLSLGLFLSFRILNTPDLTVDGSFVTGMAISAVLSLAGFPVLGLILGFAGGLTAGAVTGLLHTRLKIQPILAGILTMTALYSINLRIMGGKPNLSLYKKPTIFLGLKASGIPYAELLLLGLIVILLVLLVTLFLKTQLGTSLRATGDNEEMVRASSIDTDAMKILGLALANGLVALSGGLLGQLQQFADNNGGLGMLVLGLASIIIGETLFGRGRLLHHLISICGGTIIYRFVLTFALSLGLAASDLKLFSSVLVVAALAVPMIGASRRKRRKPHAETE